MRPVPVVMMLNDYHVSHSLARICSIIRATFLFQGFAGFCSFFLQATKAKKRCFKTVIVMTPPPKACPIPFLIMPETFWPQPFEWHCADIWKEFTSTFCLAVKSRTDHSNSSSPQYSWAIHSWRLLFFVVGCIAIRDSIQLQMECFVLFVRRSSHPCCCFLVVGEGIHCNVWLGC